MSGPLKKPTRSSRRLAKKEEKRCNHESYAQISSKEDHLSSGKVSYDASCHGEKLQNHQDTPGKSSSPVSPSCSPIYPVSERAVERETRPGMSGKEYNIGSNPELQVVLKGITLAEIAGREPSTQAQEGKKEEAAAGVEGSGPVERAGVEPSMAARKWKDSGLAGEETSKAGRVGRAGAEANTAEKDGTTPAGPAGDVHAERTGPNTAGREDVRHAGRAGTEPSTAETEAGTAETAAGMAEMTAGTAERAAGTAETTAETAETTAETAGTAAGTAEMAETAAGGAAQAK